MTSPVNAGTRPPVTAPATQRLPAGAIGAASVDPRAGAHLDPLKEKKLKGVAQQLEGVFVQQMYKAMRATVPTDEGVLTGGSGEDMFTGLMDEHIAADTPSQWQGGLGEALLQQLRGKMIRNGEAAPTSNAVTEGSR
jgi:peptidoglycan hydrolase FlgJ